MEVLYPSSPVFPWPGSGPSGSPEPLSDEQASKNDNPKKANATVGQTWVKKDLLSFFITVLMFLF